MKRLSIVIPMYNVEPYVERCLRSLENQDIPEEDYEVVCINDGSPDNSREVVLRLQKEFKNILLIDQENQGVSRARNNGIEKASGKYFLFIDPDDYVEHNSFKRILEKAEETKVQVAFLGYTFLNVDGSVRKTIFYNEHKAGVFPGTEAYFIARQDGQTDPDRMVGVLFDREFLNVNSLRYLPGVPYLEDGELIARIMCLAERCIFDDRSFYLRTTRPGSATNSRLFHAPKTIKGFLICASSLKAFQEEKDLSEVQKRFLDQPIVKFVLLSISIFPKSGWRSDMVSIVAQLNQGGLKKCALSGCRKPYRLLGRIYNFSPYLASMFLYIWPHIRRFFG